MRRPSQIVGRTWPTGVSWSLFQGMNRAPIRTLFSPWAGCKIRFVPPGCCSLPSELMHAWRRGESRSHPNAVWKSLGQRPATPACRRTVKVVLPSSTVMIMLCRAGKPDCYPGANTVRARFFGSAPVLCSTVLCHYHRMAVLSPPPLGGREGGRITTPPLLRTRPGRVRNSFRSSTG